MVTMLRVILYRGLRIIVLVITLAGRAVHTLHALVVIPLSLLLLVGDVSAIVTRSPMECAQLSVESDNQPCLIKDAIPSVRTTLIPTMIFQVLKHEAKIEPP
jgi:hypothetical protein